MNTYTTTSPIHSKSLSTPPPTHIPPFRSSISHPKMSSSFRRRPHHRPIPTPTLLPTDSSPHQQPVVLTPTRALPLNPGHEHSHRSLHASILLGVSVVVVSTASESDQADAWPLVLIVVAVLPPTNLCVRVRGIEIWVVAVRRTPLRVIQGGERWFVWWVRRGVPCCGKRRHGVVKVPFGVVVAAATS